MIGSLKAESQKQSADPDSDMQSLQEVADEHAVQGSIRHLATLMMRIVVALTCIICANSRWDIDNETHTKADPVLMHSSRKHKAKARWTQQQPGSTQANTHNQ